MSVGDGSRQTKNEREERELSDVSPREDLSASPLPLPPPRPKTGHKGTFGRVLVVAGSRGMSGAACLAGMGALRGGAGLVHLAVPSSIESIVCGYDPSYLVHGLSDNHEGRLDAGCEVPLGELQRGMDAVVIGPGLGSSPGGQTLVADWLGSLSTPLLLDADALNALAVQGWGLREVRPAGPRLITPHPGEMARLLGLSTADVQRDRLMHAAGLARLWRTTVVLKGAGTIVTDGDRWATNSTGNPGLATGGTGDVLSGLLGALLAQGMEVFEAARLGVWLHGTAGDIAAAELSEPGLIASDLPQYLGAAWRRALPTRAVGRSRLGFSDSAGAASTD